MALNIHIRIVWYDIQVYPGKIIQTFCINLNSKKMKDFCCTNIKYHKHGNFQHEQSSFQFIIFAFLAWLKHARFINCVIWEFYSFLCCCFFFVLIHLELCSFHSIFVFFCSVNYSLILFECINAVPSIILIHVRLNGKF